MANKVIIELIATDEASAKFLGATRKIEASVKGLEASTKQSLGSVGGAFQTFKENWVKVTAAIAAAYGAVRSAAWVWEEFKQATAAGEQIHVFAMKTGMAAEEISKLRYAAEMVGVPLENMDLAIVRMIKNTGEAANGTGKAKDAIRELGIDAAKLGNLDVDTQLMVLAKAFSEVKDETDQTRLAMALFGRGGAAMVPLLQGGVEQLQKYKKEAEEFGLVISDDMAQAADQAHDAIQRFEGAVRVLKMELALLAAPGVSDILTGLTEFIKTIREATGETKEFGKSVKDNLKQDENPLQNTVGWIQDYIDAAKEGVAWTEKLGTAFKTAFSMVLRMPNIPTAPFMWLKDYGENKRIEEQKKKYGPAEAGIVGPGSETAGEGVNLPDVFIPKSKTGTGIDIKGADKAMEIYKELLQSQTLTKAQLESLWEGYKQARLIQIQAEESELKKLVSKGLDPALISQVIKNRKDNLETELVALRTEIAKKAVDAEVTVYKGLMDSQNLVSDDMTGVWEDYKNKRIEQIQLEAQAMEQLKIDSETITDYVRTQTKQLDKDIEAFRGKHRETMTPAQVAEFQAPVIEKTLTTEETPAAEWQAAWAQYEKYRVQVIEKELQDMEELKYDEDIILMERKRKYRELYDYIDSRRESTLEGEIEMLRDLTSSESISAEDRKIIWKEYYDAMIQQIELAGQKMKEMGQNAQMVDVWVKAATADVKKEMNRATDEWTMAFDSFTEVVDSSFKSGIGDMFKNGVDDMSNYWQEFLNTMVEAWMRAVAQMAVNKILWGNIGGKEKGGGGGLFGILNKNEKTVETGLGKGQAQGQGPAQPANINAASMNTVAIQNATFANANLAGVSGIREENIMPGEGAAVSKEATSNIVAAAESDFSALQKASIRLEAEGALFSFMPAKETSMQMGFTQINSTLMSISSQMTALSSQIMQQNMQESIDTATNVTTFGPPGGTETGGAETVRAQNGGMFFNESNRYSVTRMQTGGIVFGSMPAIPRMQSGGVAMTPTNVLIGDTPEIILPLNRFASFMDDYDRQRNRRTGKSMVVNYNISTPDVASFQQSRGQIMASTSQALIRGRRDL